MSIGRGAPRGGLAAALAEGDGGALEGAAAEAPSVLGSARPVGAGSAVVEAIAA
jgi:hypothetical protein